jgi:hypothetical protein
MERLADAVAHGEMAMLSDIQERNEQRYRHRQMLTELRNVPETVQGIVMLYVSIYLRGFLLPVALLAALLMAATFGADSLWKLF